LPELRRNGYSGALSTGVLAAGGTLGILIPPSIVLVVYAVLTEQNIVKMFMAALIPGILAAIGYVITVSVYVRLSPDSSGVLERKSYSERWRSLRSVWPVALIFVLVIGGIYVGWFTPTEGAAVGAVATGLYAMGTGRLDGPTFVDCVLETAVASAMIYFIILGAAAFNTFLALTQLPQAAATWAQTSGYAPLAILALILVCYLILGCVMDSLSMMLLTIPVFFPVVMALDFGLGPEETAIWFGILVLIVVEVGLITPPVGLNLFIINSMAPGVSIGDTYRGVLPFVASDIVRTMILVAFPAITLWLVRVGF
jgi:tripartite ATP-independent transporter DctM subunit